MIRRRIVLIYWVAAISLFMPSAAYAYIDPATTTYLIQIATALVVTIGVSLSIFLYRFRMISSKIHFWFYGLVYRSKAKERQAAGQPGADPGQEAEHYTLPAYALPGGDASPELGSFGEDVREALSKNKADLISDKSGKSTETPKTFTGKMRMVFPLALAFCFSFIVIGSLELTIQFAPEIPFRATVVLPVVLLCFAVFLAIMIFIVPRFRSPVYEVLLIIGLAVLIAGYLQGNFLNWGLGQLTGDAVIWSNFGPQIAASLIAWAGSFVLVILLYRKARKVWRSLLLFVPVLVILFQGIGFITVVNESANNTRWASGLFWQTADETLTIDRINEVSPVQNAIVIVLDRLDQEFIEDIKAEDPHFFDPLDGFTEFDDFISYFGSTIPSVAGYLTGHIWRYDMPRSDYYSYAWANAEFFLTLKERGLDIRIYLDKGAAFDTIYQLNGIASNTFEGQLGINKRIALVKLLKLSGYRYAPIFFKQYFWLSPYEFYDAMELTDKTAPYMVNNFGYYDSLKLNGLSTSDIGEKSMIYIHLQGPHPPLNMDENIQYVEESTLTAQTKGSYRIVYEYLDQLKGLGLYENSVIVIMGDHGNFLGNDLERPARTGLMVKPAGAAGTPLQVSHAPVSPGQLHATLMEGLFGDSEGFGPAFFDVREGDDVTREYAINLWRYVITGDGRDFNNWRYIGKYPSEFW